MSIRTLVGVGSGHFVVAAAADDDVDVSVVNVTVVRGWSDDVFRTVEYRPEDAIVGVGVVVCAVGVVENELAFAVIDNEAMHDNDGVIDVATD